MVGLCGWNASFHIRKQKVRTADGHGAFEKRCGKIFERPVIPFGAPVECLPIKEASGTMASQKLKSIIGANSEDALMCLLTVQRIPSAKYARKPSPQSTV